jgi:hypothetical protein
VSVFNEPPTGQPRHRALFIAMAGGVAVLVAIVGYLLAHRSVHPEGAARATPAPASSAAAATPGASSPPESLSPPTRPPDAGRPGSRAARSKAPTPTAPPASVPAPTRVLVVESDVAGASVFLDRKFLGTTPLTTSDVEPGTHQLNVSAEGHDGLVRTVDIAATGETAVSLKFREVRLDAAVPVVHRHAMGACEGRLVANVSGLSYLTSNKGDAFAVPFADLEVFEVDYMQKNLKVKRRGGKTWNFTDKTPNADALFVFHRDVEKARQKLASR